MEIEYTGRKTTVTKKLKTQAEAGLARIAKLVSKTASAHVFLTTEKYRHTAEVTLKTRKQSLVATCEATEMESALHDALAKLEQQAIRHNKKKANEKRHPKAGSAALKDAAKMVDDEPVAPKQSKKAVAAAKKAAVNGRDGGRDGGRAGAGRKGEAMVVHSFPSKTSFVEPHIVRSIDSAAMRPMSLEEAVKEAAFRDRDVFVFRDRDSQVMVLHRMRDGKMELIQIP